MQVCFVGGLNFTIILMVSDVNRRSGFVHLPKLTSLITYRIFLQLPCGEHSLQ